MDYTTSELAILSSMNWLHLLATVAWIGGMIFVIAAVTPAAKETLEPPVMGRFMGSLMKKFRVMIYVSIGLLVATGIVMMFMNEESGGTFDFGNTWTLFLVLKHIFVLILIILGIYMMEVIVPKIGRLGAKGPSPEMAKAQKLQMRIGAINFILAILILICTAVNGAISVLV
jgi:uncharacterized membrane protein